MSGEKFVAKVAEKQELSERVVKVHLELVEPARIEFEAGMHVGVEVGDERREYSIASTPKMDHGIELVAEVGEGRGGRYFGELKPGDEARFGAPSGEMRVEGQAERRVFVAEKMGIVAVRSMLVDELVNKKSEVLMSLYWGLEYADEMFWEEELRQLEEEYENFVIDIVLARPPVMGWSLCTGTVVDCLTAHEEKFSETWYAIVGGGEMVEAVRKILAEQGVGEERVKVEVQ